MEKREVIFCPVYSYSLLVVEVYEGGSHKKDWLVLMCNGKSLLFVKNYNRVMLKIGVEFLKAE
jgi:hypothetical protein